MSTQPSWPVVFEVTFTTIEGSTHRYRVLTWLDERKAVAVAT